MITSIPQSFAERRVLVTGAGGFIGSSLVHALVREGAIVSGIDVDPGRLGKIEKPKFQFIPCDLSDGEMVKEAFADFGPEIVYHLASTPDGKETFEQHRASIQGNLGLTVNVLDAMVQVQGSVLVYGDSCKVYGDAPVPHRADREAHPVSSYAIAKAAGWQFCELYRKLHGIQTVAMRPTLVYGPQQSFNLITYVVNCVLDEKSEVRLDGGDQTRDPLYIDDAVAAYIKAGQLGQAIGGGVINLGGGKERMVRSIAELIVKLMGSDIPVTSVAGKIRPTEMLRSWCDNMDAAELLAWQPAHSLEAGLHNTIQYLIKERNPDSERSATTMESCNAHVTSRQTTPQGAPIHTQQTAFTLDVAAWQSAQVG